MHDKIEEVGSYERDDVQTEEGLLSSASSRLYGAVAGVAALATLGLGACAGNPAPTDNPFPEEEETVEERQTITVRGPTAQGTYDAELELSFRAESPVTMRDILNSFPPNCQQADLELDFGYGARGTRYGSEIDDATWEDRNCDGNFDGNGQDWIRDVDKDDRITQRNIEDFEAAQQYLLSQVQAGFFGSDHQHELYVNGDRIDPEGEEIDPEDLGLN